MYTHTFLMQLRAEVWLKVNYYECVLEEMKKLKPNMSLRVWTLNVKRQ